MARQIVNHPLIQDYSNPITRFAMQDYPIECGGAMGEVFNAQKMILDIPSEIATQTVRVDGELFYLNELLQRKSGDYFIPERFFFAKLSDQDPSVAVRHEELYALGRKVQSSEVGTLSLL